MQPAITSLVYTMTPSSGGAVANIDIAKGLSTVNRRLYRQGMNYAVASVSVGRFDTGITKAFVQTAGNTWMVQNAWKKGFALWRDQQREVEKLLPGTSGTWADFKVTLDDVVTSGTLNPRNSTTGGSAGDPVCDEWNYSEYVWDDDGTEREPQFHLIGATDLTSSIGLVQEYHISRVRQSDPSPFVDADASDSIYAKALGTDQMSDMLVDNVESENDFPPYDADQMYGGDTAGDMAPVIDEFSASMHGSGRSVPFIAPCGLLRVSLESRVNTDPANPEVLVNSDVEHAVFVHLAPGGYKGVLAEPMGQ